MTNMAAAIRHGNNTKKRRELLWPRMVMKKWLNIKSTGEEFSADEFSADEQEEGKDPDSESESESEYEPSENLSPKRCTTQRFSPLLVRRNVNDDDVPFKSYTDSIKRNEVENPHRHSMGKDELRITVGTWNVGAVMPPPDLDMKDWLDLDNPSDIYVLGFQEIIPLNVGNVFVAEDSVPTAEWQNLIRKTLNRPKPRQSAKCWSAPLSPSMKMALDAIDDSEMDTELVDEETNFIPPFSSLKEGEDQSSGGKADLVGVYRRMERINLSSSRVERVVSEPIKWPHVDSTHSPAFSDEGDWNQILYSRVSAKKNQTRYVCIASKQMVGIHISIWVKRKLRQYIQNLTVSSVGLGIMGCLGNKGSISVSMLLHGTNFCFICTHLTAGGKEGDELRRNADVTEILRRTRFPSTKKDHIKVPKTIMQHE